MHRLRLQTGPRAALFAAGLLMLWFLLELVPAHVARVTEIAASAGGPTPAFQLFSLLCIAPFAALAGPVALVLPMQGIIVAWLCAVACGMARVTRHSWARALWLVPLLIHPFGIALAPHHPALGVPDATPAVFVDVQTRRQSTLRVYATLFEQEGCLYELGGWIDDERFVFRRWCDGHREWMGDLQTGEPGPWQQIDVRGASVALGGALPPVAPPAPACQPLPWHAGPYSSATHPRHRVLRDSPSELASPGRHWMAVRRAFVSGGSDLALIRCTPVS